MAGHASHRLVVDLVANELPQVPNASDAFKAPVGLNPRRFGQLVAFSEGLSDVSEHADFVADFRGDVRHVFLLGEGEDGGLEQRLVELIELVLLGVLDLPLDVEGQQFHLVVERLRQLGLALRGELTAVQGHVGQSIVVKMHRTCLVQVHLLFL